MVVGTLARRRRRRPAADRGHLAAAPALAGAGPAGDARPEPDPAADGDERAGRRHQAGDAAVSLADTHRPGPVPARTDLVVIGAGMGMLVARLFRLQYTRYGIWLRAVAQNRPMAAALGVPVPRVYILAFIVCSGLAAWPAGCCCRSRGLPDRRQRRHPQRLHHGRRRRPGQLPRRGHRRRSWSARSSRWVARSWHQAVGAEADPVRAGDRAADGARRSASTPLVRL